MHSLFILRSALLASFLLACSFRAIPAGQEPTPKKRVAVLNFDNPRVGSDNSNAFGADGASVGRGVSAQLIQKLLQSGKYIVIDRSALEKLLQEQSEVSGSNANAYSTAAKIGQLLGLDAMIIGAVTRYGPDEKHGGAATSVLHPGVHSRKSKAYVEITARILSMTTAEILGEFHGSGESSAMGEVSTISTRGHGLSTEMLSSDFADKLFGDATSSAVEQLASELSLYAARIPALQVAYEGLVAEVAGNTLTLNIGKEAGVKPGDQIHIYREKSPAPIPVREFVGLATITAAADNFSTATFSGSVTPQVGDHISAFPKP